MAIATGILTSRKFDTVPSLGKVHLVERNYTTGLPDFTQVTVPSDVQLTMNRPAFVGIGKWTFILGMWDHPVLKAQDGLLYRSGIRTPPPPGTGSWGVTSGAGSTEHVCAIAFRHRLDTAAGSVIIAESSMSRTTAVTGDASRTWATLPTTSLDTRVTHIVGYVSIANSEMQEAWEYPIGISGLSESEIALGAVGSTLREPPPFARYGELFDFKLWLAGNPEHPYRIYRSQNEEYEAFDGATGFLDLKDREVITGMKRAGNVLFVFSNYAAYAITGHGYKTSDYSIDKVSPSFGTISHWSLVNIDEWLWLLAEEGVAVWDGTRFRYMMKDLRTFFSEAFLADYTTYRDCHAIDNKRNKMYDLLIPRSAGHFSYLGHYQPVYEDGQEQPDWFFKDRGRYEYALGRMRLAADIPRVYVSDTVGFIRQENITVAPNLDDDGDTMARKCVVQSRMEYGEGYIPGGDPLKGKEWKGVDVYLRCEGTSWGLSGWGGDESAVESTATPPFNITVPDSTVAGKVALERHYKQPEALIGDGVSIRVTITSPAAGTRYKGYGLEWIPGEQARIASS